MEASIKKSIKWVKEGDLVHVQPDCAEFPESAPSTSSFYSGSVLQLGSGIILLGGQIWSYLSISLSNSASFPPCYLEK